MIALFLAVFNSVAAAGKTPSLVRLHYFDTRGLAEPIRLTLADLGLDWEEMAHSAETWKEAKPKGIESGLFTFGQMPALEYTDADGKQFTMTQSTAILQFLGRQHGLYGTQALSDEQVIKVDVVTGGVADVKKRYKSVAYSKPSDLAKELEEYKTFLDLWLPYFERLAPARGLSAADESFTVPDYITGCFTIADALLYDTLDTCVLRVDPGALSSFPKLRALMKRIESRANIAAYLKSPRRRNYANGVSATYDTPTSPPPHFKSADEL